MDPFDGEDHDQMSVQEDPNGDEVQALLQADLELSPLVTPTPLQNQFVAGLSNALPQSPNERPSVILSPKKRKADDAILTESEFPQISTLDPPAREERKKACSAQELLVGRSAGDQQQTGESGEHAPKRMKVHPEVTASNSANPTEQVRATSASLQDAKYTQDLSDPVAAPTSELTKGNKTNLASNESKPPPSASMTPEKREAMRKQDILAIVTGTRNSISKPDGDTKSQTGKPPEANESLDLSALKSPKDDKNANAFRKDRKRAPKPIRRILNARKETEQAVAFIDNAVDLLDYLPEDDCRFLAGSLWIFTKNQLQGVLDPTSFINDITLHVDERSRMKESAEAIRSKLREKLAERFYLDRRPEEKQVYAEYRKAVIKALVEECKTGNFVPVPFPFFKSRNVTLEEKNDLRQCGEAPTQSEISQTGVLEEKIISKETAAPSSNQHSSTGATPGNDVKPEIVSGDEANRRDMQETFSSNPFNMPRPVTANANTDNPNLSVPHLFSPFYNRPREIISGVEAVLAKRPSMDLSPKEEQDIARAEDTMTEWLKRLTKPPQKLTPAEDRFHFDGPISVLIPRSSRCFLATMKLMSLFKFLRTRRTETGALCEMLLIFRRECKLPYLNHLALARHLIGLSTRMETAVGSRLPLDDKTRRWMSGSLIVCTGAALDFIVHRLGMSASWQFLDSKTKALSIELATWREEKGLPLLKGSGKVAMISAWKAMLREEDDAEKGVCKILAEIDLEKEASKGTPIVHDEMDPSEIVFRKSPINFFNASSVNADHASHSPLFVEHCLGKEAANFLAEFRVNTASQLEAAELEKNSLIAERMQECGMADSIKACHTLIQQWRRALGDTAQTMEFKKPVGKPTKKLENKPAAYSDPFDALSAVTREFLISIGITTGEQFLSQRTTDISDKFVAFRIEKGMPELKGFGAIASVSGWKAQCRKAATDMGLTKLAEVEPENTRNSGVRRKQTRSKEKSSDPVGDIMVPGPSRKVNIQPLLPLEEIPDEEILAGRSKVSLSVLRGHGPARRFDFEISVRKKSKELESFYFVTYKGCADHLSKIRNHVQNIELQRSGLMPLRVPILPVASLIHSSNSSNYDARETFSTIALGCGLIELSCCGVRPPRNQDLTPLKLFIEDFMLSRQSETLFSQDPPADDANVLVLRRMSGIQLFLFLKNPVEKGQTIPLKFPSVATLLSGEYAKLNKNASEQDKIDYHRKVAINTVLGVLSEADLREILLWAHDKYGNTSNSKEDVSNEGDSMRRRLHWLSRSALKYIRDPSEIDAEITSALFHWPRILSSPNSHDVKSSKRALSALCDDILAFLEDHPLCGSRIRENWFELARGRFPAFLENLVANLFSEDEDLAEGERLEKSKSAIEAFTFIETPSVTSLQLGKVHCSTDSADEKNSILMVACNDPISTSAKVDFKTVDEVKDNYHEVALSWYRGILCGIAHGVLKSILDLFDDGGEKSNVLKTVRALIESGPLQENKDILIPQEFTGTQSRTSLSRGTQAGEGSTSDAVPASYQFFLGIVWPALREQRWRLEAGEDAEDVSFFPPKIGKLKRPNTAKNEGNKKRQRLAREVDKIGWGALGKLTQRIVLVATKPHDVENAFTVDAALDQVLQWIQKDFSPEDSLSKEKANVIVSATRDCYNKVAPLMADCLGWKAIEASADECSSKYGSETLLQLLLVLPTILRQSSLPLQQISDSLQIIREFVDVFSAVSTKVLPQHMQPEAEVYADESIPDASGLAGRLKLMHSAADTGDSVKAVDNKSSELTEIILASDKATPDGRPLLTDFVVLVMEQVIPIRATDEDAEKKNRRIHVGYPGMTCRHCMGKHGEGRYFFSSLESMSTASTVLEKHMMRCPAVSNELKSAICEARVRHALQRKNVPIGEQQAFFNRLWGRLRSGVFGGSAANVVARPKKEEDLPGAEDDSDSVAVEFHDHLEILDFVRTALPWKNIKSVQTALNTYYSCLDYGGRIYQTPSMPKHFSSEWLLAKVVPKRYEYLKAKYLD